MAKRLFALRNVPTDEALDVRALLEEHVIEYHETDAGFFGLGTAAIWVNDEADFVRAKQLIAEYQKRRFHTAHQTYLQQKARGEQRRFFELFIQNPGQIILYILIALALISLTTLPFWL